MTQQQQIKADIKKKFGTYSRFCRLAGIDRYYYIQIGLVVKHPDPELLKKLATLTKKTKNKCIEGDICEWQREAVRHKIEQEYGNIHQFCQEHKEFPLSSVNFILTGKRTRMSKKAKMLFEYFNI